MRKGDCVLVYGTKSAEPEIDPRNPIDVFTGELYRLKPRIAQPRGWS
jgi:hypothetical protein